MGGQKNSLAQSFSVSSNFHHAHVFQHAQREASVFSPPNSLGTDQTYVEKNT